MKLLTPFRFSLFRSRAILVALVVFSAAVFAGIQLVTAAIASPQETPPVGNNSPLFGSVETSGDVKVGQFLRVGNAIKPSGISPSVLVDPNLDIGKALRVDTISHYGAGATSVAINDSVNIQKNLTVQGGTLDLGGPWIQNADGTPIPPYLQAFNLGATTYPPKSISVNAPGGTSISGGLSTDSFFVKSGTIATLPGEYLNLNISKGLKAHSVISNTNTSLLLGGAQGILVGTGPGTPTAGATFTPTSVGLTLDKGLSVDSLTIGSAWNATKFTPTANTLLGAPTWMADANFSGNVMMSGGLGVSGVFTLKSAKPNASGLPYPQLTTDTFGNYFQFNRPLQTNGITINDPSGKTSSALVAKGTDLYLLSGGLITNKVSNGANVTFDLSDPDMLTVKSPVISFQSGGKSPTTTWLQDMIVAGTLSVNGPVNATSVGKWTYARNTFNFKNNTNQLPVVAAVCPANSVVVGCTGDIDLGSVKSGNLTLLNYLGTLIPNWTASFSAGGVNVPGNRVCLGRARQQSAQAFPDSAIFAVQASCFSPQG